MAGDPQVPGLTAISNTTGAFGETVQTPPSQDQFTLALLTSQATFGVAPPTGVAVTDTANITAAIAKAQAAGGGVVQLQAGTYAVASKLRAISVTVAAHASSFTVTTGTVSAADKGSYITGPTQTNPLPIATITDSTHFVTTGASDAAITAGAVQVVVPAIFLPPGVRLAGAGGLATSNFFTLTPFKVAATTTILDSGTGDTVMLAGASQTASVTGYSAAYGISNLAIWGANTGTPGTTRAGVVVPNGVWFLMMTNVDVEFHGTAGMIFDGNMNSAEIRSCNISNNGTAAATALTGGVLATYWNSDTSASLQFNNCTFFGNAGIGVSAILSGSTFGVQAIGLDHCQIVNTIQSAAGGVLFGTNGYGFMTNSGGAGVNHLHHCWFGTNAGGDLYNNGGAMVATNCSFNSPVTNQIVNGTYASNCGLSLIGGYSNQASGVVASNSGALNWSGFEINFASTATLYAGGPGINQCLGSGSSGSFGASNNAVTVAANAGTCPVTTLLDTFTNSSAATMTITIATSGAYDGQMKWVRVYDFSAASQTITWVNTENGEGTAPTTSNGSTTLPKTVLFMFNAATTKWRCVIT